jgi:hypothetical protein
MTRKDIFCESCEEEFNIKCRNDDIVIGFCPSCGEEIDTDWNVSEDQED